MVLAAARFRHSSAAKPATAFRDACLNASIAPSGLWLLDETSGTTLTDSSGNSRNGTYNALPSKVSSLVPSDTVGQANSYTNTSKYANVAYGSWLTTTSLSLVFWLKTSYTPGAAGVIIDRLQDNTSVIETYAVSIITGGYCRFTYYNAAGGVDASTNTTSTVNDGTARMIGITKDTGTSVKYYLNGTIDNSATGSSGLWQNANGQGSIQISDYFTHVTDAVGLWGGVLTATDMSNIYAASQP